MIQIGSDCRTAICSNWSNAAPIQGDVERMSLASTGSRSAPSGWKCPCHRAIVLPARCH